eukprot:jgi/Mesen1/1204/ME000128S00177
MFLNREETAVHALYRDPVHDFGFVRYDPTAVHFLAYDAIPLAPEAAAVGLEIRVVGNDSGEKVSILAGTLARLDRDAPHYSREGYNDFNTFYMQAASGTKGGSSGSPVVDGRGRAVALNAGSKNKSASAFFLPLDRVVRALRLLQASKDPLSCPAAWDPPVIPRGTLQMTLLHKGFDETRRLGLRRESEECVRAAAGPAETGCLVVDSTVPQGPADKQLEPGDVLLRVNGQGREGEGDCKKHKAVLLLLLLLVVVVVVMTLRLMVTVPLLLRLGLGLGLGVQVTTKFLELEAVLDDSVGGSVRLQVERGGAPVDVALRVGDLHAVTPASFLELSGGVLHALSYQQARNFQLPCGLVYVAEPGYLLSRAGVPKHAIVQRLGGRDTPTLAAFLAAYEAQTPGARVPLQYLTHTDRYRPKSVLATMDRHQWYAPPQMNTRDDRTGLWTRTPALPSASPSPSPCLPVVPECSPAATAAANAEPVANGDCGDVTMAGGDGASSGGGDRVREREEGQSHFQQAGSSPSSSPSAAAAAAAAAAAGPHKGAGTAAAPAPAEAAVASAEEAAAGEERAGKRRRGAAHDGNHAPDADKASHAHSHSHSRAAPNGPAPPPGNAAAASSRKEGVGPAEAEGATGGGSQAQAPSQSAVEESLEPALVMLEVHVPPAGMVDGIHAQHFYGTAVVVHHSARLGLIVADRNTVAISVSDVMVSFAAYPVEIPAEVVFLHPMYNFALVAYDPSALAPAAAAAIRAATLLPGLCVPALSPVDERRCLMAAGFLERICTLLARVQVGEPYSDIHLAKPWRGNCQLGGGAKKVKCNRKLIGARFFVEGLLAAGDSVDLTVDSYSARDVDGHGSHTASTAGGNSGVEVRLGEGGPSYGCMSGMAPRARIAAYKGLWASAAAPGQTYGTSVDLMAALDAAVYFGQAFSGVLANDAGHVYALWGSFSTQVKYSDGSEDHQFMRGIPVRHIARVLHRILHEGGVAGSAPGEGEEGASPSLRESEGVREGEGDGGAGGVPRQGALLQRWRIPRVRVLEAEVQPLLLSKARAFGLSDAWIQKLAARDPVRRQVLRVKCTFAGSRAEGVLEQGDIVLAVDGQLVTCTDHLDAACDRLDAPQLPDAASCPAVDAGGADAGVPNGVAVEARPSSSSSPPSGSGGSDGKGALRFTILRQGEEVEVEAGVEERDGHGTTRLLTWAGCMLQEPHPAVRSLGFLPPQGHGVYCSRCAT